MNAAQKIPALFGLLKAAAAMTSEAAEHLNTDADVVTRDEAGQTDTARVDFTVGALLQVEELAEQLQAILAAARAIQRVRS